MDLINQSQCGAKRARYCLWTISYQFLMLVLCGVCFSAPSVGVEKTSKLRIVTEHLPPYQFYDENHHLTGLSVDIVNALLAKTMQDVSIEVLPWSEAYKIASEQENVLIFSIIRSKERVSQFKWVGDFLKQHYYFARLRTRHDIVINNVQDVKRYVTGVARGSFEYVLLNRYGFSAGHNLRVNTEQFPLIKQLLNGEIDLIFGSKVTVMGMMHYIHEDVNKLEFAYQLNETPGSFGIAFSRKTADEMVERYRHGFKLLQQDGTVERVINKWLMAK